MKISNNPVKYEVLIKQYLHSILDIVQMEAIVLLFIKYFSQNMQFSKGGNIIQIGLHADGGFSVMWHIYTNNAQPKI